MVSPLLSIQMKRLRFHTKGSGPTWHHHSGELDVKGHLNLHAHGHLSCTVADTSFARVKASLEERVAPSFHLGLVLEGHHPLARESL
jgi:hypothetical protein